MRLLLDEQSSPVVADQLRARGHDVMAVVEVGLAGLDDPRVLAWAVTDRRAVVTNNIKDFRPLHSTYLTMGTAHYGIVLVRTPKYSLRRDGLGPVIAALHQLLARLPADDALCDREYFL